MNDQDEMFEAATELPAFMGCPALGPKTLPGGFDGTEPAKNLQGKAENKMAKKSVKWPEGYSIEMEKNGRKIVGVITEEYIRNETYPYRFLATVYEGNEILFSIDSCARGLSFQRHVLKSAMARAIMHLSHARRNRANRRAAAKGQQAHDNKQEVK